MIRKYNLLIKRCLSLLLCNKYTGLIVAKVFKNRVPFKDGIVIDTSDSLIPAYTKALIWIKKYESAEIRFINKYLYRNQDVIELGANIGVTTCLIRKLVNSTNKIITVEANSPLIQVIEKNLYINNLNYNTHVINAAISYLPHSFLIHEEHSILNSRIVYSDETEGKPLENKTTLKSIINEHEIMNYGLVADIEGAELEILLFDENSLINCSQIIIELHATVINGAKYSVLEILELIKKNNFVVKDSYGPVYYLENNNASN